MADIQYTYKESTHTIATYDEVMNTYDWIVNAMRTVFTNKGGLQVRCSVEFSVDEMSYDCSSIEEFKKYAFGKNIVMKRMLVYVTKDWVGSLISVFANYYEGREQQEFVLSSNDEMLIINLRDALRTNKKPESTAKETVVMKIEDNSIHIGDGNTITESAIGNNNKISNISETDSKEKVSSKILWQIVVPIAVGVAVVAICVWLGIQN